MLTTDQALDRFVESEGLTEWVRYGKNGIDEWSNWKQVNTTQATDLILTIHYNDIPDNKPPSFYNQYIADGKARIIYCAIAVSSNPNTPTNGPGTLITHKVTVSGRYDQQEFIVRDTGDKYIRVGQPTDTWGVWKKITTV